MKKNTLKTYWLNSYAYIIPTILCIAYILYIIWGVNGKNIHLKWIGLSNNFSEMCKALVDFSSIVLGIYGFLIPSVIGRKDKFNETFWKNIDKHQFSKDVQKLIISGIITILLSTSLLLADVFSQKVCEILVGFLLWMLLFFCCNSFRFIKVFISLIVEGQNDDTEKNKVQFSDKDHEAKNNLDSKIDIF